MWTRNANGANKKLILHVYSGVARCQSQHQCHFWRMSLIFEAYCTDKWAWQLLIKSMSFMRLWRVAKIWRFIKGLFWKCKYFSVKMIFAPVYEILLLNTYAKSKSFCYMHAQQLSGSRSINFCHSLYQGHDFLCVRAVKTLIKLV